MSGIEISKVARERDPHVCASCMNAVTQMFSYFQEQIKELRSEKASLQDEIKRIRKVGEKQTRAMAEEIRALEGEVAMLKKESESLKESESNVA
jgi:prefoldin subunit 5